MSKNSKPIVVTVTDDAVAQIHQLADQLAAEGMEVSRVLPVTGVIGGSIAPSKVPALAKVGGVLSVEDEIISHLPPADSPLQ